MTENTPADPPDDLKDKATGRLEEDEALEEEPDLLFANIDALMDGSETPVSEPVNLDDYPPEAAELVAEDSGSSFDEATESADDGFMPVNEADEFFQQSDEPVTDTDIAEEVPAVDTNSFFDDVDETAAENVVAITDSGNPEIDQDAPVIEIGFYGKLPAYGDFIQKRLPQNFINPWHEWLQNGMLALREHDPEGWLSFYLNCPAWCFSLAAGICGDQPVAGVTIPSVDRVGRYFNFTMASILPADTSPAEFAGARHKWFAGLENLALSILDQEMEQDDIDATINQRSAETSWGQTGNPVFETGASHARIVSSDVAAMDGFMPALLHQLISQQHDRYGLWWHPGSSQVTAQLLSCDHMPVGDTYLGLIMDNELQAAAQSGSQKTEPDYMDELLSE